MKEQSSNEHASQDRAAQNTVYACPISKPTIPITDGIKKTPFQSSNPLPPRGPRKPEGQADNFLYFFPSRPDSAHICISLADLTTPDRNRIAQRLQRFVRCIMNNK